MPYFFMTSSVLPLTVGLLFSWTDQGSICIFFHVKTYDGRLGHSKHHLKVFLGLRKVNLENLLEKLMTAKYINDEQWKRQITMMMYELHYSKFLCWCYNKFPPNSGKLSHKIRARKIEQKIVIWHLLLSRIISSMHMAGG